MLEELGPELLGRVLAHLPADDLRAARRTSRLFDEASRAHSGRAATLRLTPANVHASVLIRSPGPKWSRFPQLRRLELRGWRQEGELATRLQHCFADADAVLSAIQEVDALPGDDEDADQPDGQEASLENDLDGPTWTAVLKHMPGVTRINLPARPHRLNEALCLVALTASLAPRLEELDASTWQIDALMASQMHGLRALWLGGGDDITRAVWAALPLSTLTALHFIADAPLPQGNPHPAPWSKLLVLNGIILPASSVEDLVACAPNLQRLRASATGGGWAQLPAGTAALRSVTWACMYDCSDSFLLSPHHVARMLPNVERLELCGAYGSGTRQVLADLSPLTRLTRFDATPWHSREEHFVVLQPRAWESLLGLTQLRAVCLNLTFEQLPRFAQLPAAVQAISLRVAARVENDDPVWGSGEGDELDLCAVIEAAARTPGLRALHLHVPGAKLRHTGLPRALGAAGRLRALEVSAPALRLHDISALAGLQGLKQLHVNPCESLDPADPQLGELLDDLEARGLETVLYATRDPSVDIFFSEEW